MTEGVVALILFLLTPSGEVKVHPYGVFETPKQCEAAYNGFVAEAKAAQVPPEKLRGLCFTTPWPPKGQGI